LLAAASLHFRETDAVALHYRHVSNSVCRQIMQGESMSEIALNRARGFVCSTLDPVTGGKHCSIGGGPYDYIVTSTLASQAPPAVGRALGFSLASASSSALKHVPKYPSDSISYVSVGDGSVNNAHFLSALNLAKYAQHRRFKCPVVFGVSDNGKCISLRGYDWVDKFVAQSGVKYFVADVTNVLDVFSKSNEAITHSRRFKVPTLVLYKNLPRRFGHAATDRQAAYMPAEEIAREADNNPLLGIVPAHSIR
jgi:TPP-dependent pyruvate/acetoin dehydrogenase alpha subunit